MQNLKPLFSRLLGLFGLYAALVACEKPTDDLGFNQVIGDSVEADSIHIGLTTYTADIDSVLVAFTYEQQLLLGGYNSTRLLGRTESPTFGIENANLVAELLPDQVNPDFGENPIVDSVTLYLRLTEAYGDTSQAMDLVVKEIIGEGIPKDSQIFSNYQASTGQILGQRMAYLPTPKTENRVDGQATPPLLRISLDANYFQTRFADFANGDFEPLASFSNFLDYFPGIEVSATSGGCILYTNLASNFSLLRIYYHNDEDTTFTDFNFDQDKSLVPITFSSFSQDYSMAQLANRQIDTLNGEERTYIQAMGGVCTAVRFDSAKIDSLTRAGLIVNRAIFELYTEQGTGSGVAPAPRLELRKLAGKGLGNRISDFVGSDAGDGNLRRGALRDNRYQFEVTRHLFEVLNSGENTTLAAIPVSRTSAAHRTVLKGRKAGSERAKVIVYYTKP